MKIQKIEDSIVGNRRFMTAVVNDLLKKFGYSGYSVTDTLATIQRKEGYGVVIDYLQREYLDE